MYDHLNGIAVIWRRFINEQKDLTVLNVHESQETVILKIPLCSIYIQWYRANYIWRKYVKSTCISWTFLLNWLKMALRPATFLKGGYQSFWQELDVFDCKQQQCVRYSHCGLGTKANKGLISHQSSTSKHNSLHQKKINNNGLAKLTDDRKCVNSPYKLCEQKSVSPGRLKVY